MPACKNDITSIIFNASVLLVDHLLILKELIDRSYIEQIAVTFIVAFCHFCLSAQRAAPFHYEQMSGAAETFCPPLHNFTEITTKLSPLLILENVGHNISAMRGVQHFIS